MTVRTLYGKTPIMWQIKLAKFEVVTAVLVNIKACWDVTPYWLVHRSCSVSIQLNIFILLRHLQVVNFVLRKYWILWTLVSCLSVLLCIFWGDILRIIKQFMALTYNDVTPLKLNHFLVTCWLLLQWLIILKA